MTTSLNDGAGAAVCGSDSSKLTDDVGMDAEAEE